ncbi:MAG: GGDEF domain-containing protein [Oscillospiraceae bacterium]|nr:GGDEF domain-containing protein [Oscillospiraceae bacterium]MCR4761881.1 GGDEF domain-containing protein [Oscillospiraceae bacterium]
MAFTDKDKKGKGLGYIFLAIAFALVMLLNMFLVSWIYKKSDETSQIMSQDSRTINSANGQLQSVNEQFMELIARVGVPLQHVGTINALLPAIQNALNTYEQMEGHDALATRRFHHARAYINAYQEKVTACCEKISALENGDDSEAKEAYYAELPEIYEQEIAPLQSSASQMFIASIGIANAASAKRNAALSGNMNLVRLLMLGILLLGEIAIILAGRFRKRANEEIMRKTAQFADASSKLMRSREKMEDIAVSNILTGLKNRYALEQDIGDRLVNEQFYIAVFDMDNFRSINDTYGYDFGDEYLAQVSERLKNEFEQFADIYNITGNEFCFVFKRTVSDTQALRLVDNIAAVMSSPYTIFNLTVQLSCSASTYHYMAGDCLNVNSLLVKMDNVLRNAKRAGGGQILQVVNI